MDIHKNARLTPHGRERLVKMILSGQTPQAASEAAGVCPRTGRKWRRSLQAGRPGRPAGPQLTAQSAAQADAAGASSSASQACAVSACTGKEIATDVGVSPATVSRVLKRLGLTS